ncbi:hypothetical protein GPECTOR_7g1130 [Gonium pectorale]|uniref:Uncharacterized protein n=1 Tax=Gonium pectorale TaxID=33097 RepID=A0A150GTN5_GONPE|nr:hypothetical protein GPECTOR_7g1130 [Gonium pectorale]|eukprot:KXZ53236.1 hypothetical protein GPECTOR_7g1130 [Gonium pectorale]
MQLSLGLDLAASTSACPSEGAAAVDLGKEGVLVPRNGQASHIRQVELLTMGAEVQGLYSATHGGSRVLAAVDAVGRAQLLVTTGISGSGSEEDTVGERHLLCLDATARGECGWAGLAVRSLPGATGGTAAPASMGAGGASPPDLEVAVARQRMRDVAVFRDGALVRTLHTMQGPSALTYLPAGGPYGGCADASSGLLSVAEEHQVTLWDVRQGERGGCVQRLNVSAGGFPLYALAWLACPPPGPHGAGGGSGGGGCAGSGMLAATGAERSVVVLEPRKWHVVAKWPGCVKYPATHLLPSAVAPGFVYVAGLDYECAAGRWDGSCGSSTGNMNSSSGGHGRAVGPQQLIRELQQGQTEAAVAAADDGPEASSRAGLSFRGDSKWLGLASAAVPAASDTPAGRNREVVAALSLSGNLFVMATSAVR